MDAPATLDAARRRVDEQDWASALRLLESLPADDVEACEVRAAAAYGAGDLEACLNAWEVQHRVLVGLGEPVAAARAACMVALYLLIDTGLMTPVRTWLRRAESLLDPVAEPVPPDALVAMIRGYERFFCGEPEAAAPYAARAVELGRSLKVLPAVVMGSLCLARLDLLAGDIDRGLEALDDVAALLMSGTVDPLTSGMAYCELICAAQGMLLTERARDWTDLMERWSSAHAFGGLHGRCLVHRAELLRISGPADEAERTAREACAGLRPWLRREYGWPLVELGWILLRRGDLVGAEEALLAAHERAWCPQPALALLRLEQGRADEAADLIAEAIARPIEIPWKERPPIGDLRIFLFLAAQCEIAFARSDVATARDSAARMAAIASAYGGSGLEAATALASARSALLSGDHDRAIRDAAAAVAAWSEAGAPFEVGQARLVLARALAEAGNGTAAELERSAAAETFHSFGAPSWAARSEGGRTPARASVASLTSDGTTATAVFAGRTSHLRDLVGLRTLRRLLAEPGREFHVLDLVVGHAPEGSPAEDGVDGPELGLPVLDDQAKAAYRRRLDEIEEDLAEAEADGDVGRIELAQRDRAFLVHELSAATGLGGRDRTTNDPAERARTSVARSLRYAVGVLGRHDPDLAEHLRVHLRTGVYCCYRPDPVAPIRWET